MNYYELTFTYNSPLEKEIVNDILSAELGEIGFESFVESAEGLVAYIEEKKYNSKILTDQLALFPLPDVVFNFTEKLIEGKDWNEEWEKNYFKPIRIGDECLIRASFHEPEPGFRYTIVIDPKMAFGTGNHETTYLMISEILQLDLTGKKVLDMGCGTAVLAILARMRGADKVTAIDIDEWAYNNALENIRLNGVSHIHVLEGGAEKIAEDAPFDYVFANINRNILLNDLSVYAEHMQRGGTLFMSGFYEEDIPAIRSAAEQQGLIFQSFTVRNNWVAVQTQKA
ncbi:50S ribosomal protein L11 methyltransferase [Parabacteroides sp. PF5-9]|uniref:50S ribosomal protein L11 methyltransferase n=1 Tax=Parabacteroides sp. PF5-9 TaxID=1742404 RepID=UPI0024756E49|nr:50S ribosomal protein L11 methyltransferase [Parabacteroides sp. PF5-9]MDH6359134.1 ribosomal protein L11 methyltransferase [Parabacteroides sp. PF5-9]